MSTGRAVLLKGAADVAARAASIITFPILAHYAGADGYGAYGQMTVIVGFLVPFASLGLGSVMVRFLTGSPWTRSVSRHAFKVGATVLVGGIAFSAVIALIAPTLNELFLRWPDGDALFRWGSLLIVLGAVEFWLLDLMRAREWLISFSLFQLGQTAVVVVAVVVMLPAGYSIVDLVIATAVLKAVAIVVTFSLVVLRAPQEPEPSEPIAHASFDRMVRFGLPLTVAGLGLWMVNLSDRLVIGGFMTPSDLGLYGAAYTVGSLLVLCGAALFLPAYPRFMAAVAEGNRGKLGADIELFHRYLSLTVVPGAVFLVTLMHPALLVLGGSEFDVSLVVGTLIVAGLFLDQWNGLAHYVLPCFDRTVFLQNAWLGCGVLNIALNLIAVPLWGLKGAAAVTLISFVVLESIVFFAARRHVDLVRRYRFGTTMRAAIAAGVGAAAAIAVLSAVASELLGVILASAAFWAVYVVGAVLLRELRRSDLAVVLRALGLRHRLAQG
jgi:O-antigen/teichoic acid export membrane protein